jgi:hypothetical protein
MPQIQVHFGTEFERFLIQTRFKTLLKNLYGFYNMAGNFVVFLAKLQTWLEKKTTKIWYPSVRFFKYP